MTHARCPRQGPMSGVFSLTQAGRSGPPTPHVAARSSGWHPSFHPEGQDQPRPVHHQGHGAISPERLPPTSPTACSRALARSPAAWAATGTPASPPRTQLPTCFHAPTQGALDPRAKRLFAVDALATCRPSASAMECPSTTPPPCLTPSVHRGEPRHQLGDHTPCGAQPAGRSQVRGHLASSTASTPTSATARRGGFTPT